MLPWTTLIPTAISLAEMAGKVLSSNKKEKLKIDNTADADTASLIKRIEILEKNELKQAEILQQLTQQNLILIQKAEKNYKFAIIGLSISIIAIVACIFLLALKL
ncbi:hypothetical protein [Aequorivita echinoideorum]|uniref:Uncharacterized protein n=1 Tax=Aequorivita echinoideorum TaxID=1549647 RepID=A0ABS5S4K0_9FLAO|nr:hypothetical protein [Aequorivita echinoideorum]MBT0608149.1 hypothetical protein [Aequorivita echinoideorum]